MAAGTGPAAMEVPMTTPTRSSGPLVSGPLVSGPLVSGPLVSGPLVSGLWLGRKVRRLAGAAAGGLALLALSLLLGRSPHDVLAALPGAPGEADPDFGIGG
jgi:hypothetical protein